MQHSTTSTSQQLVLSFSMSSFSKLESVSLLRRGVTISPALLNKRSTGADDGMGVLYRANTCATELNILRLARDLSLSAM